MDEVECVVVGAGVVGLAIARELAVRGREVVVLEAEAVKGAHASSRNTGVIHGGINYAPGSAKARLCLRGKRRLYQYCAEHNIPHEQIGKLVICGAASGGAGLDLLRSMQSRARQNGLEEIFLLSAREARRMEPQLVCGGALWSPTSGIIDVHAYMDALHGDIEDHRGAVAFSCPLRSGRVEGGKIILSTGDQHASQISCRILINAAGFNAPLLAAAVENRDRNDIPQRLLSKGTYCVLKRRSPFSRLIYPAPHGVHATVDVAGCLRFGPDAEWVDEVDYTLDEDRIAPFYDEIRAFWPDLRDGDLAPGWTGIRAKINKGKTNETDFRIDWFATDGCCVVDLFGIDSPGLTASLVVAEEVAARMAAVTR